MPNKGRWVVVWTVIALAGFPAVMLVAHELALDTRTLTIPYRLLIFVGAIAVALTASRAIKRPFSAASLSFWVLLLFCAMYSLKLVFVLFVAREPVPDAPITYIVYAVAGCFIPAICAAALRADSVSESSLTESVFWTCLLVGGAWLFTLRDAFGTDFGRLRYSGLNQITLGHLGVTLIIVSLLRLVKSSRNALRRVRPITSILGVIVGAGLMLLAASRGPVVALLVCLTALVYVFARERFASFIAVTFVAGFALIFAGPGLIEITQSLGSGLVNRITATFESGTGLSERSYLYMAAINRGSENPFFGGGLLIDGTWPHNMVLEAFSFLGVFGAALFLLLLFVLMRNALHLLRKRKWVIVPLLFIQYSLFYTFSGAIWQATMFWIAAGLVIACSLALRDKECQRPG